MDFSNASVNLEASLALFVYPFLFNPQNFERRVRTLETALIPTRKGEKKLWDEHPFPQNDLLAHVADYLNCPNRVAPTARRWKLTQKEDDLPGLLGLKDNIQWELLSPGRATPFGFGESGRGNLAFDLALFSIGVGFLTLRAQPQGSQVSDWLEFIHYIRFLGGNRNIQIRARKSTGFDPQTQQKIYEPFFPEWVKGGAPRSQGTGLLDELLFTLLATGSVGREQQWWREVFIPGQLLPFVSLFVEGLNADQRPHLLYKLRNFFHPDQGNHPAPEDLQLDHPHLLSYAQNQWFIMSLDGGAFLACDAPETEFFRYTLPDHLRDEYFVLFLLVLHQRFALMSLSFQVAKRWLVRSEAQREKAFESIREQLLAFTARGYFSQAMQREHHHRCYLKWQEVFQIERLYQEVSDEVREMHDYALQRRTQRVEDKINVLAIFLGIPGLIIGFLGINLLGLTSSSDGITLGTALLICGVGLGVSAVFWLVVRR